MAEIAVASRMPYLGVPKMVIRDNTGFAFSVPYAPRIVDVDQEGLEWQESRRPGRLAALRVAAIKPKRIRMEFMLGDMNGGSIVTQMSWFTWIANRDVHCTISYSAIEVGPWRMTECSYQVVHRNTNNEPCQAKMVITFQAIPLDSIIPGPIAARKATPSSGAGGGRSYTVKRGDTLWALAVKYYGSGLQWRRIADANGVRDPRKLQIGTVLRIP